MKIAYIITSLRDLSLVHVVLDLVNSMSANGHSCKVFYFKEQTELEFPCQIEKISLFSKIQFSDFDVVHVHGLLPDLYLFLHKPFKTNTLFVNTIHSFLYPDYINSKGRILGRFIAFSHLFLMRRLDKSVCMSQVAVKYYSQYLNPKKLTYSYNTKVIDYKEQPTDSELKIIQQFKSKYKILCGAICVVSDIKGLDQIIKSLSLNPDCGFIIVGCGPAVPKLQNLANVLKVEAQVLFMGFKSNAYKFLPYFDIFCIPSHSEGCPVAMLEAAAFGKAMISTDLPIFYELFTDEESVKFPMNDIAKCAEVIREAYCKSAYYGGNARKKFESNYSFDCFYKRYLKIYSREI